jgi:tRNA threonylcarbamoyladenosine biosynthesis protein TsaB
LFSSFFNINDNFNFYEFRIKYKNKKPDKFQKNDTVDVAYFEPYYLKDFMITTAAKYSALEKGYF